MTWKDKLLLKIGDAKSKFGVKGLNTVSKFEINKNTLESTKEDFSNENTFATLSLNKPSTAISMRRKRNKVNPKPEPDSPTS